MKTVMQILFIGSYTEYPIPSFGGIGHGIYTVQLNTENGELSTLHTERARNPSYLTISHDNRFLYCNTELDENENPKVRAYKINKDFSLDFINEMPISGGYPCHINIFKKKCFDSMLFNWQCSTISVGRFRKVDVLQKNLLP